MRAWHAVPSTDGARNSTSSSSERWYGPAVPAGYGQARNYAKRDGPWRKVCHLADRAGQSCPPAIGARARVPHLRIVPAQNVHFLKVTYLRIRPHWTRVPRHTVPMFAVKGARLSRLIQVQSAVQPL